ncbi:MAG TPA: MotA/TolQ/ExbB proton channel family protein [Bacteroidia bacterium]|nr:MotA/TolQ/ExbB proton channel family protein [Bacteroidia bacterium]
MKKVFALFLVLGLVCFQASTLNAQPDTSKKDTGTAQAGTPAPAAEATTDASTATVEETEVTSSQEIKNQFIEGDVRFMTPVLLCLILGLAIAIERVLTLSFSTTNTKKFISRIEDALNTGGVEAAKEVSRNTRGPIASIYYQGLDRAHEGIDVVEKSAVSYGSVQMGQMEKGLIWLNLFIALAPMLGFLGTVVGMIFAFDDIAKAGDISPSVVAGGIKVALLTTVAGLIVAIILQIFYNAIVSKVDSMVNTMEDASITLVDMLVKKDMSRTDGYGKTL